MVNYNNFNLLLYLDKIINFYDLRYPNKLINVFETH